MNLSQQQTLLAHKFTDAQLSLSFLHEVLIVRSFATESAVAKTVLSNGAVMDDVNPYTNISSPSPLSSPSIYWSLQHNGRQFICVYLLPINHFFRTELFNSFLWSGWATSAEMCSVVPFLWEITRRTRRTTTQSGDPSQSTRYRHPEMPSSLFSRLCSPF